MELDTKRTFEIEQKIVIKWTKMHEIWSNMMNNKPCNIQKVKQKANFDFSVHICKFSSAWGEINGFEYKAWISFNEVWQSLGS